MKKNSDKTTTKSSQQTLSTEQAKEEPIPSYSQLQKKTDNAPQRHLDGSLDQLKEQLRDAYMNFMEQHEKCVIDLPAFKKGDHRVYYFRPDTFLLEDPNKQAAFRESILKRISSMPKPEPITHLGDDLHRAYCATLADQSRPTVAKKNLAQYFKRRQYSLQHMKYKMLCRWAHLCSESRSLETGREAVFLYGKLEYSLEQSMQRAERLEQPDWFDNADPSHPSFKRRPNTKSEHGSGSLYVENQDLEPQSLIKEDDIEIWMRGVTYRNKVSRVVNKFMAKLKWLPLKHRYSVYEKALEVNRQIQVENIQEQQDLIKEVKERPYRAFSKVTPEMESDLNEILNGFYAKKYELMYASNSERTQNQWRANHDTVPDLINNNFLLKIMIERYSSKFDLKGDIEIDHGFSYAYQVSVKFPPYFQRQVIKSQFSIYDIFSGEQDRNQSLKHNLQNITRVDTNIFKDVTSSQGNIPDADSFSKELENEDIKVIRLKSAAYWIDYICIVPTIPDWTKKQHAILAHNSPIDRLLKSAINFLDVNDIASVNRINEDNAILHQQTLKKLTSFNPHEMVITKMQHSQDGTKLVNIDIQEFKNSQNEGSNIEKHLLSAATGSGISSKVGSTKTEMFRPQDTGKLGPRTGLKSTPQHLLVSLYTLRYMQSRDCKTKILYTLNFYRAIQKRISLDLREFGTRERIDSHLTQPYVFSTDSDKKAVNTINMIHNTFEGVKGKVKISDAKEKSKDAIDEDFNNFKMTIFDEKVISEMKNMATIRGYKTNGKFSNRAMSTCPSLPLFHITNGEPIYREGTDLEMDLMKQKSLVSKSSLKLIGRIDKFELNETLQEVYVKDDLGVYILFDCTLQDMTMLEEELLQIASYYLNRCEVLQDPHTEKPVPSKDRLQILDDLLFYEAQFQFKKVKLVMAYMEAYEHITDPVEQQRLMQIVTDIMARRPRLNLQANYFKDSYVAEIRCLEAQFEIIKMLIENQVKIEREANRLLQQELELAYTLANQFEQNRFKYVDAESILQALIKKRKDDIMVKSYAQAMQYQSKRTQHDDQIIKEVKDKEDESDDTEHEKLNKKKEVKRTKQESSQEVANDVKSDNSSEIPDELLTKDKEENVFQQLLGIPEVTIETLYGQYKEKDRTIIEIMKENSNFIQIHEGYPEFVNMQQGGVGGKENRTFLPCPWSTEQGNLDFYDSLGFVTKFYSISEQISNELFDALKPYNGQIMTCIEEQVALHALQQYREVIQIMEGSLIEYNGRQYVEDETITGNAEKITFFTKEMIANLTTQPKLVLDPYLISKLDINTIMFYEYPKLKKTDSKFNKMDTKSTNHPKWVDKLFKQSMVDQAKRKATINSSALDHLVTSAHINVNTTRNVKVPSLLQTYCNVMEFLRIRNEIILAASECSVLQQVLNTLAQQCGITKPVINMASDIGYDTVEMADEEDIVNYIDEGPAHKLDIDLGIKEFDSLLLSNFNFRSPDAFLCSITTSGLEEARAVLAYQVMQKQQLIVATRANMLMCDSSLKSYSELELLQKFEIGVPNAAFDYSLTFSKNTDQASNSLIKDVKMKFSNNLKINVSNVFFECISKKGIGRASISKEFSNYMATVRRIYSVKPQCMQRVMRSFKIKQLMRYCSSVLLDLYLEAQKVQTLLTCQRLRCMTRLFDFEPKSVGMRVEKVPNSIDDKFLYQVMKFETSTMIENFTMAYWPTDDEETNDEDGKVQKDIYVLNPDCTNSCLYGIPSSKRIMQCRAASREEWEVYAKKQFNSFIQFSLDAIQPPFEGEEGVKEMELKKQQVKEYLTKCHEHLPSLNPEDQDPELYIKQTLPTIKFREMEDYLKSQTQKQKSSTQNNDGFDEFGYSVMDYNEALSFGKSTFAKNMRYFTYLERIFSLEWFITKLQFRQDLVYNFENAINTGCHFWKPNDYDARRIEEMQSSSNDKIDSQNLITIDYFKSMADSYKSKKYIAEELSEMSTILTNLIKHCEKVKLEERFEYLHSYTEFRYYQIMNSLHKLSYDFMKKKSPNVKAVREAIRNLTKMEHVKINYENSNSYHVNTSLTSSQMQFLENANFIHGSYTFEENENFQRCIQPILNEKALEPPQLALFKSLYQVDSFRRRMPNQFAGQLVSTHNGQPFKSLETALLDLWPKERQYCQSIIVQQKFVVHDFMETTDNSNTIKRMQRNELYTLPQLADAKKFLAETTQNILLKNAILCWDFNQILPDDPSVFEKIEKHYISTYFWKILQQKENIVNSMQLRVGDNLQIPSKEKLDRLKEEIDKLQANYSLATKKDEEFRDEMIECLNKEFNAMKKKVTLDNYFSVKAEIQVLANEIERQLVRASVVALDSEHAALTKCFNICVPSVQFHIHPFQQFAATQYDKVDVNSHLDLVNKINPIQELLSKLRNRGTEVETLTSGPGMVFTVRDLNDCIQDFSRGMIKYADKEFKSRQDFFFKKEEQLYNLIYVKDQRIKSLENRIANMGRNIENLTSARLFEQGNQLIYQLDATSRILILFKQNMFGLENHIKSTILGEQSHKFKLQKDALDTQIEMLNDYKNHISQIVKYKFTEDQNQMLVALKKKAEDAKNTNADTSMYKAKMLYPGTGSSKHVKAGTIMAPAVGDQESAFKGSKASYYGHSNNMPVKGRLVSEELQVIGSLPGSIVPKGFKHYHHCSCFVPDPDYPHHTMEAAEIHLLSEQEARFELAKMCETMRKQRLFWRTKEMLQKQRFQDEINKLKKQVSNNAYLWDQMAESEKREKILKQELLFTQQSLASAEKVIEKLQEEMRKYESVQQRLKRYKDQNTERLKEYEHKLKKFEIYENVDTDKLINVLTKKQQEVTALKTIADNFNEQMAVVHHKKDQEVGAIKQKYVKEQVKTQQMIERMEQMKLELKMLESNDSSVAAIWKKKCLDLFEVCQTLKKENEELRDRCKQVIEQGLQLADQINKEDISMNSPITQTTPHLPRLLNTGSAQKLQNQTQVQGTSYYSTQSVGKPVMTPGMSGRAATAATGNLDTTIGGNPLLYGTSTPQNIQNSVAGIDRMSFVASSSGQEPGLRISSQDWQNSNYGNYFTNKQFAQTMFGTRDQHVNQNQSYPLQQMNTPRQDQLASQFGNTIRGRDKMNQKLIMPQTSQQPRGRTVQPQNNMAPQSQGRPGFQRPKYKQNDIRSILGSGYGDRSFDNQSVGLPSTISNNPPLVQTQFPRNIQALGSNIQIQQTRNITLNQQRKQKDVSGMKAFNAVLQNHKEHNDSLFESSKASAKHFMVSKKTFQTNVKATNPGAITVTNYSMQQPVAFNNNRDLEPLQGAPMIMSSHVKQSAGGIAQLNSRDIKGSTKIESMVSNVTTQHHTKTRESQKSQEFFNQMSMGGQREHSNLSGLQSQHFESSEQQRFGQPDRVQTILRDKSMLDEPKNQEPANSANTPIKTDIKSHKEIK